MKDSELIETMIGHPPVGWTLGHVTIALTRNGKLKGSQPIEAMRRGAFAVHEVELSDGRKWRLSHAPSGLQVWTFDQLEQAIELAERIESFTAWSEITKMLPIGTDLYPKVQAVIDEIEGSGLSPQQGGGDPK